MVTDMDTLASAWRCLKEGDITLRQPRLLRQLVSFFLVGICSNLLGYCFYLLLVRLRLDPKLAITFLYFIGVFISFIGNKKLTFGQTGSTLASGSRYLAAYFFGYIVNLLLILWLVDIMGLPHHVVQFFAISIVALLMFILLRKFVFVRYPSN